MNILYSFVKAIFIDFEGYFDHLKRSLTGGPSAKTSEITPQLFVGGQYGRRGINRLKGWGITAVISLRLVDPKLAKKSGFSVLHLPTKNLTGPSQDDLKKGIQFIKKEIKKGGKVYIHCNHGVGRAPTMAAAYLMSEGLTFEDALARIKKVRKFVKLSKSQKKALLK